MSEFFTFLNKAGEYLLNFNRLVFGMNLASLFKRKFKKDHANMSNFIGKVTTLGAAFALVGLGFVAGPGAARADSLVSLNSPVTCNSANFSGSQFACSNVDDGVLDNHNFNGYWLAAQGAGAEVTINLGSVFNISEIDVQDTHNDGFNDYGTQGFTISVSSDGTNFTDLATSAFTNSQWQNDTILNFSLATSGQYVQFTANSTFGGNAGLAEMSVYGSAAPDVPEPASVALFGFGAAVLGMVRRRRA